jgi:hypothetical protein
MAKNNKRAEVEITLDVKDELDYLLKNGDVITMRASIGNEDARRVATLMAGMGVCQCPACVNRLAATTYAYRHGLVN